MSAASLGPHLGHAYVPGYGQAEVFDTDRPNFFTVQVNKTGIRHWVARDRVQWRR